MRGGRLHWQLFPSFLIIAVLSVAGIAVFAGRELRGFYIERAASSLEVRVRLLREYVAESIHGGDIDVLQDRCERFSRQSGTRFTVIGADGTVIADTGLEPQRSRNEGSSPEVTDALRGQRGLHIRVGDDGQERTMYVAIPFEEAVGPTAVLRAASTIAPLERRLASLYRWIAVGGLLVVVLAAGLSVLFTRRVTRPLAALTRGANRFAAGEFGSRLSLSRQDEIGELSNAMDRMAGQLDRRIEELVQQKNQEEAILASMVEAVIAVDTAGRLLVANQAAERLFGVAFARSSGQPIQEVARHSRLHDVVVRAIRSEEAFEEQITLYDPEERFLQVHGTVVRSPGGEVLGALLVFNDMTRMHRLERVRRDFVANVSHELRTPITTIKGFVETLLGGAVEDAADTERFLGIIARHTERLNAIIEDLLALSRLEQESKEERIATERLKMHDVLRQAIDACRVPAQTRNIQLALTGDDRMECSLNGPLVEQAVVNLIDNAIKYSDEGGRVEVWNELAQDGLVAIRVRDHGCGVEPEHIPRLFERFYRTDKARSRSLGGTGLGLSIVKHIALAHGGRVDVASRVGEGSTFSIFVPC